jgi:phosphoglycerol transferase MdoB-like AlkP superfamily enzyme
MTSSIDSKATPSAWSAFGLAILPYVLVTGLLMGITALFEWYGGLAGLWWHKILELPLALYLYYFCRQLLYNRRFSWLLAALPVLFLYIMIDAYFLIFKRVFRISEINEIPELLDVLPWYFTALMGIMVVVPIVWMLTRLRIQSYKKLLWSIIPGLLLVGSLIWRPDWFLQAFTSTANGIVEWSDEESVRRNGRLSMVLYQEAKRRAAIKKAREYLSDETYDEQHKQKLEALKSTLKPRNVHIFVLESYFDPARLANLNLNQDAVHPEFRKLLVNNGMGDLSTSPVWGGYTPQAEFEFLCGIRALQKLGTIEFNVMTGAPIHCLPEVLAQSGYQSISSRGFKPFFFNSISAMKALGFEENYYAREYAPNRKTYLSTGDVSAEKYMFDTPLFDQNLAFIKERMASQPNKPLLNYILTIYGHFPFKIDESVRPRIIEPLGPAEADEELKVLLNQVYYRSEATARYIAQLTEIDPDGLIILVADHLPPLRKGINEYERLGYLAGEEDANHQTFMAVIDRGKPYKVGKQHHYDLPNLVYERLSDQQYCEQAESLCAPRNEKEQTQDYMRLMAHAVADPK